MNLVNLSTNLASHFFDLVIGKILTSRLSLSKHLAHNLGNLLLLGKIGVFHNRRNASSRLLLLISKHLILCIYLVFRNPQCLASISRWITASSSWKRFCLFVCRALSSIMVICMLTAIRLLLTFVMSLYLLLRS